MRGGPAVTTPASRALELLGILAIVGAAFLLRWQFREALLIRDEGELAHLGAEILKGNVPYRDVYNQKTPFSFYFMALVWKLFGPSVAALHVATTVWLTLTGLIVYRIARNLFSRGAALWALVAFFVLFFDQAGAVHQSSTETYMVFWIALAFWLWLDDRERPWWRFLLAGAAACMAFQTKQFGLVVLPALYAERLWRWLVERRRRTEPFSAVLRDCACALLGWALVYGAIAAYFASQGAFDEYLECTWTHNLQYVGRRWYSPEVLVAVLEAVNRKVARWDRWLWLLGTLSLLVLAVRRKPRLGNGIWVFLAALACMALTGAESYVHYFEPLIVPFSLGIGVACAALTRGILGDEMRIWVRPFLVPILLLPWFYPALQHASYFVVRTRDGFRQMTAEEFETGIRTFAPFNASPAVARYIAERTEPDECFMIVGSEPQIFFYADRSSCTRIAFLYPATGPYTYASQLSAEFFRDLVTKRPRYVLLLRLRSSVGHGDPEQDAFLETALAILERDYYVESELPEEPVAPGEPAGYVWVYRRYE